MVKRYLCKITINTLMCQYISRICKTFKNLKNILSFFKLLISIIF